MQQKPIIITSIVLAIAASLGITYLLASPAFDRSPEEITPPVSLLPTPTPLAITPRPTAIPQITGGPAVDGTSVTAEAGAGHLILIVSLTAILVGAFNLTKQLKLTKNF